MFRRSIVLAGTGVVTLGLAGPLAAISAGDSAAARTRHNPPTPRVRTLGVTRPVELVSFCWSYQNGDGTGGGECADGEVHKPDRTLRWRSRNRFVVDFRLPAHDVGVEAVRLTGGRQRHVVQAHVAAANGSGRRWLLRLPRRAAADNVLIISARFAQGDVEAELGIRRVRPS